ncbi:MAG: aldo/keto reductase [Deltaproteobacteria bacterium]|nr:aldo/keto reductase [Deltaproteobacteria bacterium]
MKTVSFGGGQRQVSIAGLGGEGVLRTFGRGTEAQSVIRQAVSQGVTYFDSARVYSDSEVYYGSIWEHDPGLRESIFQTSKSASRDKDSALADLAATLQRLHTPYLDLWQIHDVRTEEDLLTISGPGGALEAFVEAKKSGLVRAIGVTGHHDPAVLTRAVREWPVDAVLLPVNPVEGVLGGFLTHTMEAARQKGIAVIGMKILGAAHYILPELGVTAELLIRYALSSGVTVAIVGCATAEEVRTLAVAAAQPLLSEQERSGLHNIFRPYAARLAFYRGVL